jgi:hypothetical protein
MFPESVRNATHTAAVSTQIGMKSVYGFSRNALWIVFSTSIILFAPVIFEVERAQMEEMQRNQQKQVRRVATCRGAIFNCHVADASRAEHGCIRRRYAFNASDAAIMGSNDDSSESFRVFLMSYVVCSSIVKFLFNIIDELRVVAF